MNRKKHHWKQQQERQVKTIRVDLDPDKLRPMFPPEMTVESVGIIDSLLSDIKATEQPEHYLEDAFASGVLMALNVFKFSESFLSEGQFVYAARLILALEAIAERRDQDQGSGTR